MKRSNNIYIIILLLFLFSSQAYAAKNIYRIYLPGEDIPKDILIINPDIASYKPGEYIDLVLEQEEFKKFRMGWDYRIEIWETEDTLKSRLDPEYHTYSEVQTILENYELNNSTLCKLYDIGDAWEKTVGGSSYNINYGSREIWMLKISDNPSIDEEEPELLFIGAHHAREPISTEVVLYMMNELINGYSTDPEIKSWVDNFEIFFIPILNPDGHAVVLDGDNVWWRKNCRDNDGNKSFIAINDGVDPNRNYGWFWGGAGSSPNPEEEIFRGESPFSEPETKAIRKLANERNFYISVSFHSYGEVVMFPFGYADDSVAPDDFTLREISDSVAEKIIKASGVGTYQSLASRDFYPAAGDSDDWLYGNNGIFSYTIELATSFIPPGSSINTISSRSWEGCKEYFRRLNGPLLFGNVYDAETSLPMQVRITNNFVDTNMINPRKSNETTGEYHWILPEGSFQFTFSKAGYIPKTVSIKINSTPVKRNIYLEKLPGEFQFGIEPTVIPNPAKNSPYQTIHFNILTTGAKIECEIYNISGNLIRKFEPKYSNGDPYHDRIIWFLKNDNGEDIASGIYLAVLKISKDNNTIIKKMKLAVIH